MKNKKTSFNVKLGIIIIIIIICFIIVDPFMIHNTINNKAYMYKTNLVGNSMYPMLNDGDTGIVLLKSSPNYDLQVGDIAVFYYADCSCYVGHRVIYIDDDYILTKGDNNEEIDAIVQEEYIIGELVDHIPQYNFIRLWIVERILG